MILKIRLPSCRGVSGAWKASEINGILPDQSDPEKFSWVYTSRLVDPISVVGRADELADDWEGELLAFVGLLEFEEEA